MSEELVNDIKNSQENNQVLISDIKNTQNSYDEKIAIVKRQKEAAEEQKQKSDRSLKDKVERLFNQGMQIEDIAQELSCPVSEVQFIIDML